MDVRSREQMMAKCKTHDAISMTVLTAVATSVLSVDNRRSMERVGRHTVAVLPRIERAMLFSILSMANPCDTTRTTLSNTLLLI